MALNWNTIRANAAGFARDWADARYERGETQSFYNDFFEVFGIRRRRVATFEEPVKKLGEKQGFIDLFWKGVLLVEHKSAGRDLTRARTQALDYFPGLKEHELPRYVLVCDFQLFELVDLDTGEETRFPLADLHLHVEKFGFIVGVEKRVFKDQDPVNILAAELMGKLHDALKASGYDGHPLERLLVRLLFCLFADDTGIFPERGMLEDFIVNRTGADGADLGPWLIQIFQVLNTAEPKRQSSLDEDLARFPYVNGDLFAEALPIPSCDAKMRLLLIEACGFSWERISPAIFGALFQSVMNAKERRAKGAHYTTEKNILKVIEPLFLDDLRAEFARIRALRRGREPALRAFQDKLAGLNLFDPACGCGNFLIIAYRELRALEIEVLKLLYPDGQLDLEASALSKVDVNQFHGIEIDEFPARIAETAMWMMDHIMNNRLSLEFGQVFARIPLKAAPNIRHGDALETDWADVLPPERCSYVLGNPPFLGAKVQSEGQREQVRRIAALGKSGGTLDFVAAWFIKAGAYLQHSRARVGFVSTNSITQGEQVAQLWPLLFDRYGLRISFAHRTFAWGSDARGKAHVHVVVIGLAHANDLHGDCVLFDYPDIGGEPIGNRVDCINGYLIAGPNIIAAGRSSPLSDVSPVMNGSVAADGGHLILSPEERAQIIAESPVSEKYIRQFVGAQDLIHGQLRYCIWAAGADPHELRMIPAFSTRAKLVREFRLASTKAATRQKGEIPLLFTENRQPRTRYVAIPRTSSEARDYIPMAFQGSEVIAANDIQFVAKPELWSFGVLTSRAHMAWVDVTSGRLKSDIRYSAVHTFNTFPWPKLTGADKARLDGLAQTVLDARLAHPGATLADLYDPDVMPADLRKAHRALDLAVDRLYRKEPFASDRERVEHLFRLYEQMTAGLLATPAKKGRRKAAAR